MMMMMITLDESIAVKYGPNHFAGGTSDVRGGSRYSAVRKSVTKKQVLVKAYSEEFVILGVTVYTRESSYAFSVS